MLSATIKNELQNLFGDAVAFNVPLKDHTSIRIGGPADAVVWPKDSRALSMALLFAKEKNLPLFILGKGSNTLVRDDGFRGIVVSLIKGFRQFEKSKEDGKEVWVAVEGGVPTQQLVRWTAMEGLTGLERLAGVPGTIGGNIFMNAGTYLGEVGELVEEVRFCDRAGRERVLKREGLKFQYRTSNIPPSSAITWALLRLEKGSKEKIEEEIKKVFEKRGLAQPIESPNLGSVFKNPGKKKAWELIEEAGCKGVRVGKARISDKHANFIINEGGALAKDVEILIKLVKDKVKQVCGETLETEIKVIGEGQ